MRAFHGSQALKDQITERLDLHYQQDEIIKGHFWSYGKGCMWGCSLHSKTPHQVVEEQVGIPEVISRISDRIFEELPLPEAQEFPMQFHRSIPVGSNLSLVWPQLAIWLIEQMKPCLPIELEIEITSLEFLFRRVVRGGVVDADRFLNIETAISALDQFFYLYPSGHSFSLIESMTYSSVSDAARSAATALSYAAITITHFGRNEREEFFRMTRNRLLSLLANAPQS